MSYKKFLKNLLKESLKYPYGKPKELRKEWEDLTHEEQGYWSDLAKSRLMQVYYLAHLAFLEKQSHGVPEEMSWMLIKDHLLDEKEISLYHKCLYHFKEAHSLLSRKSAKSLFGKLN